VTLAGTVAERLSAALADRYRIERELGAGGMATVYLAEDLRHHRKVALKVLRPELAAVIGADRFLHEITTTANLQHPHILGLHDSGQVDGTVFYVMPFVAGESLRERLTREKQLPVDTAVRIAREIASALDYAHRQGVIHRDIKPENILLHDGSALVADFGIALAASAGGSTRMTETGMSLGTPSYMSPEQAMGERVLDARTDVYALGCVLYEMLSGEPPFHCQGAGEAPRRPLRLRVGVCRRPGNGTGRLAARPDRRIARCYRTHPPPDGRADRPDSSACRSGRVGMVSPEGEPRGGALCGGV
jgi:serine/threonine-protein kinase